jgi:hypothetical protein
LATFGDDVAGRVVGRAEAFQQRFAENSAQLRTRPRIREAVKG